jgi:UDP-N-acetylglucosamine 4,6-dehydratase/UDP-glucose 4-epimerase
MANEKILEMFTNKNILITGGTGSLGQALTKKLLKSKINQIRIFSRNELKQIEMEEKFQDKRLRFFIGDVRDLSRLELAFEDVDYIFHAAALKHVPKVEYNPFESIKTNVIGSENVIAASITNNVNKVICIGTDKAVSPLNTYGATKLLMEKLFVSANNYLNIKRHPTKFIAVRYGNVLGSSGSVVPRFIEKIKRNEVLTITDPRMTRFSITMDEALDFILNAVYYGKGSEIFVPKIRAYEINELKNALFELLKNTGDKTIGIRTGEKLNEVLINEYEIPYSWEANDMYMILNPILSNKSILELAEIYPNIKKLNDFKDYASNDVEKISKNELKKIITDAKLL